MKILFSKAIVAVVLCVGAALPDAGAARGVLKNSQQTFAGACLEGKDTASRLIEICEAALAEDGASPAQRLEIRVELADALYSVDELDRAQTLVDEILKDHPTHAGALAISGWIDWDLDNFEQAALHFEAAVNIGPTSSSLAGLASSRHRAGQISQEDFFVLMDAALAINPDYTWALREKAWAQIDFDDEQGAEESFRAALKIDPENTWTLYGLGRLYNKQDRYEEAIPLLEQAAQNPNAPISVFAERSLAGFYLGNYKRALADADRVIADSPNWATGYVRRARALAALGQRQTGIEELSAYLEETRSDWATYWLADLLLDDEQYEESLAVINRIFESGSPDYYDHELRAYLLLELEQRPEAKAAIQATLALRPDAAFPMYYNALLFAREGQLEQADAAMWQALDNGLPEHRVPFYLEELTKQGAFVHAIKWRVAWRDRQAESSD